MDAPLIFAPRSEKQRMILMDESSDVLLTGGGAGSSKSYTCLLKALKYIKDPAARVMIIRESYPTLKLSGGLVDESKGIYSHFGGVFGVQALTWKFPNGATIQFSALPDNLGEWQGLQATHMLVDEAAGFKESEILFLLSRLRSAKYKGHMNLTMTCNPDANSFLYKWVEYCLDPETGIPKSGTELIERYFVTINGKMCWGNSVEELFKEYGYGKELGVDFRPLKFRFIPMTIQDNPILLKNNPTYLSNLQSQPRVNQQRFLFGSWTARPEGSSFFDRSWLEVVEYPPINPQSKIRSWDLAASVPSEATPNPDWTAGVLMSRTREGVYYIEHVKRFRKQTDGVLNEIVETAKNDGLDIPVSIPRDTGSGGKSANDFFTRFLAEQGVYVRSIQMSGHSSKINRFKPFVSLAANGHVKIVRGDWNEDFLNELEFFDGSRNIKDDQVDGTSDATNELAKQMHIPSFSIPSMEQASPIPRI